MCLVPNSLKQGCQMVYLHTENTYLGKIWMALKCKILIYIVLLFGILYDPFVYFMAIGFTYFVVIWYIFPSFVMLYQEKSGNPGLKV
jgi:hypothetical protein